MKKTHKKPIAFLAVFLFTTTLLAQTATFEWAKGYGSSGYDIGTSITTDANGNVYAVGGFSGTIDFDPGTGVSNLHPKNRCDGRINLGKKNRRE